MISSPIAARYAEALFAVAREDDSFPQTLEQLKALGELIRASQPLRDFLLNPDVSAQEKIDLLDRVYQQTWSPLVRTFVQVVMELGRAEEFSGMADAFETLVDIHQSRLRVVVRSAHPLNDHTIRRLQTVLERQQRKQVELRTEINPTLLGGMQVLVQQHVIDGTVRRQLQELRQRFTTLRIP